MTAPIRQSDFIEELCLSLAHRWEPERLFLIFTAYFDESGTHAESPILIMAGVMGSARQWRIFGRRLRNLQTELGFNIFHAKDLKAGAGEFRGWSKARQGKLLNHMVALVRDNLDLGVSLNLEKARYLAEYRGGHKPKKMPLDSAYGFAFRACLSNLIRDLRSRSGVVPKLNIVIERGHPNVGDADRIFREIQDELEQDFGVKILGDITIAEKTACEPLMVADLLAHAQYLISQAERAGGRGYPNITEASKNEARWSHIELHPDAFRVQKEQFEALKKRKAARKVSSKEAPS